MFIIQDYINGLKNGKILGSKCNKCGAVSIPPHPLCQNCGDFEVDLFETKGYGELKNFTIIYVPPKSFETKPPYVVAIIKLEEGGAVLGRLRGVNPYVIESIKIGMKVKFDPWLERDNVIVAFSPV